jgi:hypothetical protein
LLENGVRKILFIFSLALVVACGAAMAETLTLTDGSTQAGDLIKFDDNGLMLRSGDVYTNVPWGQLSQDSLKQLAGNPKIRPYVEVFIMPDVSQRPAPPVIKINPVTRLERPANPSLLGGLVGSPVGLFILLVLYAANLYAAFEVSIVRARPAAQVVGLSALLPLIGPAIFLAMPMKAESPPEEAPADAPIPPPAAAVTEEIQITDASWQPQGEKKPEAQVYARGKYTFNKRFIETRFAAFIGAKPGDLAGKYTMEVRTMKAHFTVAHIVQVTPVEVVFETVERSRQTVPMSDISEIKLNPKTA